MTSVMRHFLLLPGHQSRLSDSVKLLLPNDEILKKNQDDSMKKFTWFSVILCMCCLNEMAALKSHGLVEIKLYKKRLFQWEPYDPYVRFSLSFLNGLS